jgi:Mn2+/Fe2+ NRAMP family transporter
LFAFGLLNASLFAASILPLSTAHVICEGLGFEAGIDNKFKEAPIFYWLYTILIVVGAGIVLLPHAPLWKILIFSQVGKRVLAAGGADFHSAAGEPPGFDGRVCEHGHI